MKLKQIGNNQNLISYNNGTDVLFSYETPVAGYILGEGYFVSEEFYSKTTSRHINVFIRNAEKSLDCEIKPKKVKQNFIEGLVNA
jgi:hypothetical protein|tara:strand:+ start:816 stop:1070 length:255 start_codon:yes stop_codon:yes gene_type:complete